MEVGGCEYIYHVLGSRYIITDPIFFIICVSLQASMMLRADESRPRTWIERIVHGQCAPP